MTFTRAGKRACLQRELALRERACPRWVATDKMTQDEADRQIALMRAKLADYAEPTLFDAAH